MIPVGWGGRPPGGRAFEVKPGSPVGSWSVKGEEIVGKEPEVGHLVAF